VVVAVIEIELVLHASWGAWSHVEPIGQLFDCLFCLESSLHLWAFGLQRTLRQGASSYALGVALLVAVADIVRIGVGAIDTDGGAPVASAAHTALRAALGCRLLRLPRLIFSLEQTSATLRRLMRSMHAFLGLLGFVWVVFTLFAQLGIALFGGKIKKGTHGSPWVGPKGTELYAYANFNDFSSAMLTLFELLIVNNWYVTMDVTVAVTSGWSRAYFIAWYLLAAVGITNLVVAQVLESAGTGLPTGGGDASLWHEMAARGVSQRRHSGAAIPFRPHASASFTPDMAELVRRGPAAHQRRSASTWTFGGRHAAGGTTAIGVGTGAGSSPGSGPSPSGLVEPESTLPSTVTHNGAEAHDSDERGRPTSPASNQEAL